MVGAVTQWHVLEKRLNATTELSIAIWGGTALLLLGALGLIGRQWVRERREKRRLEEARSLGLHVPASLHPVIDQDVCIASTACVAACPEGDVLGLIEGAGRLVRGSACIGHGRCAAECPVGAIRLVFGTEERGVDIPHVTPDFETNRTGIYIAGELGGMGLIRNALRQGVAAARHASSTLGAEDESGAIDVAIVGAGPAGLGAALACKEAKASYVLLEQDTIGGTVAHYPRQKLVMTEPVDIPLFGRVHRAEMSKEELLALWNEVINESGIEVRTQTRCTGIDGEDGCFTVQTSNGPLRARKVILATGRRGTPRKLGVTGEEQPRVTYRLVDPEQYAGASVLVVGGGDSALEAALGLVEAGAKVTMSYRGTSFYRAKPKNRERIKSLAANNDLTVVFASRVEGLGEAEATLSTETGQRQLPADYVIAALGGEAPTRFLQSLGIRIDRWFGKPPESRASSAVAVKNRVSSSASLGLLALFFVYALAVAYSGWIGWDYYQLPEELREASSLHSRLRSSGSWGHGIGIIATLIMLTNFAYAARKRLGWLERAGRLRTWLAFHVAVGLMTPLVIAFHAAFQNKNLLAATTYYSLGAVVVTGIIGRWIYGRVRFGGGFGKRGQAVATLKRVMRVWRLGHVLLAILMVIAIAAHVGITILFGYRWIFG